jgi:serine protease
MRRGVLGLSVLVSLLLATAAPATATTTPATAPPATATPATPATATPATPTGNLVVLLDQSHAGTISTRAAVQATVTGLGARPAGKSVPDIGLVTVRPPRGASSAAFARMLAAVPGVASVQPELRYAPRSVPNDPALRGSGPTAGVPWQWYLMREGFNRAWGLNQGRDALVGVIDTGIDAQHPDLAAKIAATVDQQAAADSTGPADTDQIGHGTHVASLACADTGNALGLAGAGYDCRLLIEKTDFTDSSIAAAIVDAAKRHVDALNMSFGPSGGTSHPAPGSEIRALHYAAAHRVVLVAAAADSPGTEQGDPANLLQPADTGPSLSKGLGLDVTAANYGGRRASFAGSGSEISLAAYGAFRSTGPVLSPCSGSTFGLFGAFPGNSTQMESFPPTACRVTYRGDNRYATIAGTSMAAPQVAATGAMMRVLNPFASLRDILTTIKRTAERAPGQGWTSDLGWGILNAGAALEAIRRVDRLAPHSRLFVPKLSHRRSVVLRWNGHDQQHAGLIASGIAYFDVFVRPAGGHSVRLARTRRHRFRFTGLPGRRYTFWVVAIDRAGNRQRRPAHLTTRIA